MNDASTNGATRRLTADELAAWREVPTAVISDETGCRGVMSTAIRPLTPGRRFAGQAVTIRTSREANGAPARVMDHVRPGDVVVIDGSAHPTTAVWGGNLADALQRRAGAAVVVDGRVRDIVELGETTLAVCAREVTPAGLVWGGEINVAIHCGGVEVAPGMLIVGDDDGVVVLPTDGCDDVLARCRARIEMESRGRRQDAASFDAASRGDIPLPAQTSK